MSIGPFLGGLFSTLWQEFASPQEPSAGTSLPQGGSPPLQPEGPLFNVDSTPMLNGSVDVLGKLYGDGGSSLTDNSGMFGTGLHGSDG